MKQNRSVWPWVAVFAAGFVCGVAFSAAKLGIFQSSSVPKPQAQEQAKPADHPPSREARLAELEQRIAALRKMVEENPKDQRAVGELGRAYLNSGNFKDAAEVYEKALKLDPDNPDLLAQLALTYRRLDKAQDAQALLKKALEKNPAHAPSLFYMGLLYRDNLKDKKKALQSWEKFLKEAPQSQFAVMVKQWVKQLRMELNQPETGSGTK